MRRTAQQADRVRLFVALELPGQAREALLRWRAQVLGPPMTLRLIDPEHLHVTLCFLGWQELSDVDAIADVCAAADELRAVALVIDEPIWLPPGRPRVLAVRLSDPSGGARALQGTLAGALARGGWYQPERRPYLPHVTVARVPGDARVRPDAFPAPSPAAFEANEVVLYRSHLARAGARYEPLRQILLAGGG